MFSRAIGNTRGGQSDWAIRVDATETGCPERMKRLALYAYIHKYVYPYLYIEQYARLMTGFGQTIPRPKRLTSLPLIGNDIDK